MCAIKKGSGRGEQKEKRMTLGVGGCDSFIDVKEVHFIFCGRSIDGRVLPLLWEKLDGRIIVVHEEVAYTYIFLYSGR